MAAPRKSSPLKAVPGGAPGTRRPRKQAAPKAPESQRPAPSVRSAAESGTRRDLLVQLRNRLATDIDNPNTPPRDLAALSRRLLEIAKDIEALDAADRADAIGEATATPDAEWAAT